MKPRRIDFRVSMIVPDEASIEDARLYVEEAVRAWRGSLRYPGAYDHLDPGDPMHGLDEDTVVVKRLLKQRRKTR